MINEKNILHAISSTFNVFAHIWSSKYFYYKGTYYYFLKYLLRIYHKWLKEEIDFLHILKNTLNGFLYFPPLLIHQDFVTKILSSSYRFTSCQFLYKSFGLHDLDKNQFRISSTNESNKTKSFLRICMRNVIFREKIKLLTCEYLTKSRKTIK